MEVTTTQTQGAGNLRDQLQQIFHPASATRSAAFSVEISTKDDTAIIERLRGLSPQPIFCSLPWVSDANLRYEDDFTRMPSLRLAGQLQQAQYPVVSHLSCYNLTEQQVQKILATGLVRNLFIVRGDTVNPTQRFTHSFDLVDYLRRVPAEDSAGGTATASRLTIGVGGYPQGHHQSRSPTDEIRHLAEKVALGADFLLTQTLYDAASFFHYRDRCRAAGISIPIVPGIYLPHSYRQLQTMLGFTRVTLPPSVRDAFEAHAGDTPEEFEAFVVEYFSGVVRELLDPIETSIDDPVKLVHFFTFNNLSLLQKVLDRVKFE
ncbi:methylenetetrahydrofolate reductase (NADPH) [Anopheles bellator]|uniref:methylenetetrahydrofolate reductase (NADPH) n=1 Tax=Anopheles bellator TaxID=139047 RepID=UPI002649B063|nr:methylenetetrahydrofolate reductase (NADPH) [Anopheles bellator]